MNPRHYLTKRFPYQNAEKSNKNQILTSKDYNFHGVKSDSKY
jgi:hypothetical protein